MADSNLIAVAQQAAHELLVWVGFGTLVGLTAKAIMPGRDPGGAVGTLLMGIAGSLIGCGILLLFDTSYRITPISPLGFIAGTVGGRSSCSSFTASCRTAISSRRPMVRSPQAAEPR